MAERLEWVFELFDKVSGPAGKAAKGMAAMEKASHGARLGLEKLHDIVEIAYEGPKILGEVWEKASEIVNDSIAEMRFKQDNLLALEALTGTRDAAVEIFEGAEDFAYKTGQNVASIMAMTKDLVSSGFNAEEVNVLRLLIGDLRVVDPAKGEAVAAIIGEIGRRGELTARQMIGLSNAGIDQTKMFEELSKQLGIPAQVLKSMDGLKVKSGTAISAIVEVARKKYSGGIIGSLVAKESETIPALLDRVRSIPEKIMDELAGLGHGAGGSPFAHMLENIADAFDPNTPTGKRIHGAIRGFVDYLGELLGFKGAGGIFSDLAGPNGVKRVEEALKGTIEWLKTTGIPAIQSFASAVGEIAAAVVKIGGVVKFFATGDTGLPDQLTPEQKLQMARATMADPNASQQSKLWASDVIRNSYVTVHVNVNGNATKEDADHIGRVSAEHVGNALDQLAIQQGAR